MLRYGMLGMLGMESVWQKCSSETHSIATFLLLQSVVARIVVQLLGILWAIFRPFAFVTYLRMEMMSAASCRPGTSNTENNACPNSTSVPF